MVSAYSVSAPEGSPPSSSAAVVFKWSTALWSLSASGMPSSLRSVTVPSSAVVRTYQPSKAQPGRTQAVAPVTLSVAVASMAALVTSLTFSSPTMK